MKSYYTFAVSGSVFTRVINPKAKGSATFWEERQENLMGLIFIQGPKCVTESREVIKERSL